MNIRKVLISLVLGVAVSGCAGVNVSTDYDRSTDFGSMKTYSWLADSAKFSSNMAVDSSAISKADTKEKAEQTTPDKKVLKTNTIMHERIVNTVNLQLELQGFQLQQQEPDFLITYNITSEKKTDIRTYDNYGGYGPSWGWGFGYAHRGMAISTYSETRVDEYQKGTLIIDIIDPKTNRLIWRGVGSKRLPETTDVNVMDKLIHEIVSNILQKFPPLTQG